MGPSLMRSLASCIFESTPAESSSSSSKLSPAEREAARMEALQQYRTLLNNLQSCGLIEQKAVDKWERQVAREERRRVRAERERLERERGPLPMYTSVAKPAETVLASTA